MASEIVSHIGGKGNYLCHKCEVGGTGADKQMDQRYHALFTISSISIITELAKQAELMIYGMDTAVKQQQTMTGIKGILSAAVMSEIADEIQTLSPNSMEAKTMIQCLIEEKKAHLFNGTLTLTGFDSCTDTLTEILHTVLLGIVKYHIFKFNSKLLIFQSHLQAMNTQGLSIPNLQAKYIIKYAVANVIDLFATLELKQILDKVKIHLLTHLPDDVAQFGSSIEYSTEQFESYNSVFRLSSVFSN
ncbi:hypothetical protein EMPG_09283 [Blastomyces silverae]|uniref:Uncharacterized protein n=1 Tax=Blastomyces silverae TaxID=2060906 RepID=A0A0H1B4A7_9EURO|nr:hypothetical protein EMPG_09283 [Blastomyces silverae]